MDVISQRIAVIGLVLIGIMAVLSAHHLAYLGREVPGPLIALAGVAAGSIATMIVPGRLYPSHMPP